MSAQPRQAVIDEDGGVGHVRVLRGLPMGLDQAVVEAVKQWRGMASR